MSLWRGATNNSHVLRASSICGAIENWVVCRSGKFFVPNTSMACPFDMMEKKTAVGCLRTQLLEQARGLHSKVIKDGAGAVIK
jgi:hypothetical protein